jgi:hypothetical protein
MTALLNLYMENQFPRFFPFLAAGISLPLFVAVGTAFARVWTQCLDATHGARAFAKRSYQPRRFAMINIRKLFFFMAMLTGMFALQGCDANDGPLEDAAEEVDDAVDDVGDDIDDALD